MDETRTRKARNVLIKCSAIIFEKAFIKGIKKMGPNIHKRNIG